MTVPGRLQRFLGLIHGNADASRNGVASRIESHANDFQLIRRKLNFENDALILQNLDQLTARLEVQMLHSIYFWIAE